MPLEDVGRQRLCRDVRHGVLLQPHVVLPQPGRRRVGPTGHDCRTGDPLFYATGMDLLTFAELKFKPGIVLVEVVAPN